MGLFLGFFGVGVVVDWWLFGVVCDWYDGYGDVGLLFGRGFGGGCVW